MPNWLQIVLGIIAALGGVGGLAAIVTARSTARKTDVEALTQTIDTLAARNKKLLERVEKLEKRQDEAQVIIDALRERIRHLEDERQDLIRRIEELERENCHLRQQVEKAPQSDPGAGHA